jgi:hypothetical protein
MKRFLVFASYYGNTQHGYSTFRAAFESKGDAVDWAKTTSYDWWHVADTKAGKIVEEKK